MAKVNNLSLMIGGEAGAGVMASGAVFAKACVRGGLNVFATNEYLSLIRGGHNWYLMRIREDRVFSQRYSVDLLIALDELTVRKHAKRLHSASGLIVDEVHKIPEEVEKKGVKIYKVPLTEIVTRLKAPRVMRNSAALGAAVALLDYDLELLKSVIKDVFAKRPELAELNIAVAEEGYKYVKANYDTNEFEFKLEPRGDKGYIFLTGNESVALGAVKAGMKVYVAYPMTPASPILHFLAAHQYTLDVVVLQAESEIAAINTVIGAAYAGVRAMTGTSGGGFCLMVEALSKAGAIEVPVVIVLAQRPGPSTGMPTFTAQGDLRFALHAGQGEFPRIVAAPGDIEEAFYVTFDVFNLSEKYQMPAIILIDKYLAESAQSVPPFKSDLTIERGDIIMGTYTGSEEYKRYKFTETGVSPRAIPGTKNAIVRANSSEHDEYGFVSTDPEIVTKMIDKRLRKMKYLLEELESKYQPVKTYGDENSPIALVSWGSPKGPILEALKELSAENVSVKYIQIIYLSPFPVNTTRKALQNVKKLILVENNRTGQLGSLLSEYLHVTPDVSLLKYDGRPFYPEEIVEKVLEVS